MSDFRFEVWPTEHRAITQPFGANPHYYRQFGLPGHEGVDLRAPNGSKVFCVAPGRVYRVHRNPGGHNYGVHVRVQHQNGFLTVYGHLQEAFVNPGDDVNAGTILGLADSTGNSFGSHLHLTLKKRGARQKNWPDEIIDPTPYLVPLLGWQSPAGPFTKGWVAVLGVSIVDELAQALSGGVTLRLGPEESQHVPEGTLMVVNGPRQGGYLPVLVATASLEDLKETPPAPSGGPAPHEATITGWAWADFLTITGTLGVVNTRYGINLRERATRNSKNLGIIKRNSTVAISDFSGSEPENGYLSVRARRIDMIGPVQAPEPTIPKEPPRENPDPNNRAQGLFLGWVPTHFLKINGLRGESPHRSISLQSAPSTRGKYMGTIRSNSPISVAGQAEGTYTPIMVRGSDFLRLIRPLPIVELPEPLSAADVSEIGDEILEPLQLSVPGWVLSGELIRDGSEAKASKEGLNLREHPRRDAKILGFIPAESDLFITDEPLGEYTPVRIDEADLQPSPEEIGESAIEPPLLGQARIGLHASADPQISPAEHREFADLRPGVIKLLSFHAPDDVEKLAKAHPNASWIIRAFLSMDQRRVTPRQFLTDTYPDVQRALDKLRGRQVVIELHNEPNLHEEGATQSWSNGAEFNDWFLELLTLYRQALPAAKFIFPGLSPGNAVHGIKQDHILFVEACRPAIEAADGLGVHIYWSHIYPMQKALDVLDDYLSRFRHTPVWVTEASNNKAGTPVERKAQEYLKFWRELQTRPYVRGVTYFVASASNPAFREEVWVGRGIGRWVGMR